MTEFLQLYFITGLIVINFFSIADEDFNDGATESPVSVMLFWPAILWSISAFGRLGRPTKP